MWVLPPFEINTTGRLLVKINMLWSNAPPSVYVILSSLMLRQADHFTYVKKFSLKWTEVFDQTISCHSENQLSYTSTISQGHHPAKNMPDVHHRVSLVIPTHFQGWYSIGFDLLGKNQYAIDSSTHACCPFSPVFFFCEETLWIIWVSNVFLGFPTQADIGQVGIFQPGKLGNGFECCTTNPLLVNI